jgi:hypothetical protein
MTAFADYLDLRLAVSEKVGRTDISDVMPRLVRAAESDLNKKVRHKSMLTEVTLAFTAGRATLPAGFLEFLDVFDASGCRLKETTRTTANANPSDDRLYYIDETEVVNATFTGNRTANYYTALPTLTASVTTSNWLLQEAPTLYEAAVTRQAALFVKDAELINASTTWLGDELRELHRQDVRHRYGDARIVLDGVVP